MTHDEYGVEEQVWNDFLVLRKAKRAPLTKTALTRMANEAAKAKISLGEAMAICCEHGWQAFKAEWVKDESPKPKTGVRNWTTDPKEYPKDVVPKPEAAKKILDSLIGKMVM